MQRGSVCTDGRLAWRAGDGAEAKAPAVLLWVASGIVVLLPPRASVAVFGDSYARIAAPLSLPSPFDIMLRPSGPDLDFPPFLGTVPHSKLTAFHLRLTENRHDA
ncbi:hypothetical protein Fuma_03587 [Fuerstiella marisgermanici]|uniref:Uncharacterized protein n=1 Tax=Fuerstiella marisgermanici TaxID=1891926 RepID=A0A1P8WIS3_9PLAN|nr:hypothetical protein Fuma_03587 [Fuerstiella marisgermanici]